MKNIIISLFIISPSLIAISFTNCQLSPSSELAVTINEWEFVASNTEPLARHENAFTELDGKFYLIGGRNNKPINIFDPETNIWTEGAIPPLEMHHFQALPFKNEIYVLGAFTGGFPHEDPIPDIYAYNPTSDSWRSVTKIPEDRRRGAAGVAAYNNKIYVLCGIQNGHYDGHVSWFDEYDPATGQWLRLADAPRSRDHFQVGMIGTKLFAAGGRNTSAKTNKTLELTIPEVDVYDFSTGQWETLDQPLPTLRAGTGAVTFGNLLMIIGGESGTQVPAHNEVEAYNIEQDKWITLPSLQQGRHGTQALIFQDTIFIAAGSGNRGGGPELTSMEKYGPSKK